jgi:Integrase core domain
MLICRLFRQSLLNSGTRYRLSPRRPSWPLSNSISSGCKPFNGRSINSPNASTRTPPTPARRPATRPTLNADRPSPRRVARGEGNPAIRGWMASAGLENLYIEPGAPWENGYAESFNSKVRDELLNAEQFGSLLEARVLAKAWKQEYNQVRPHRSLGYRTPAEYGAMVPRADSAALRRPEELSVTVDPTLTAPGPKNGGKSPTFRCLSSW